MTTRSAAAVLAGLFLFLGLAIGLLLPVSVDGVRCGSAAVQAADYQRAYATAYAVASAGHPDQAPAAAFSAATVGARCQSAVTDRRVVGALLAGVGAVTVVGLALTRPQQVSQLARM